MSLRGGGVAAPRERRRFGREVARNGEGGSANRRAGPTVAPEQLSSGEKMNCSQNWSIAKKCYDATKGRKEEGAPLGWHWGEESHTLREKNMALRGCCLTLLDS